MLRWKTKCVERDSARHVARVLAGTDESIDAWLEIDQDAERVKGFVREFYEADAVVEQLMQDEEVSQLLDGIECMGRKSTRFRFVSAVAASILLVASVTGVWVGLNSTAVDDVAYRYVSRVGEQKDVVLDDGSKMILNTGSEVLVSYSEIDRQVSVRRGEVFFDVEKDPEKPFRVEVGDRSVAVLGTAFSIRKKNTGLELAVQEGEVVLYSTGDTLDTRAIPLSKVGGQSFGDGGQRRVLAGWKVDVSRDFMSVSRTENIAGWRDGVLHFVNCPMVEVVKELNRYSIKKILIEDSEVVKIHVTASINIDRIPSVLRAIAQGYDLRLIEELGHISISTK